jgi:hypothetical protein
LLILALILLIPLYILLIVVYTNGMAQVSEAKKDQIVNGISAGMLLEDMFILTNCTPEDMLQLNADKFFLARCKCAGKELERDLLTNLSEIIRVQTDKGKDHATIWLLGKMNPRFSERPEMGDKPGVINIITQPVDISKMSTVEIHSPVAKSSLPTLTTDCSSTPDSDLPLDGTDIKEEDLY